MKNENCLVGTKVKINHKQWDPLLHGLTGTVIERDTAFEALVRLDTYLPEFDGYEDLRSGCVTLNPEDLEVV